METSEFGYRVKLSETLRWNKKTLANLTRWWRNYRTRKQLPQLSNHLLEDIGITHEQARKESMRHFWDG